jgi:hypothetical protein
LYIPWYLSVIDVLNKACGGIWGGAGAGCYIAISFFGDIGAWATVQLDGLAGMAVIYVFHGLRNFAFGKRDSNIRR